MLSSDYSFFFELQTLLSTLRKLKRPLAQNLLYTCKNTVKRWFDMTAGKMLFLQTRW